MFYYTYYKQNSEQGHNHKQQEWQQFREGQKKTKGGVLVSVLLDYSEDVCVFTGRDLI